MNIFSQKTIGRIFNKTWFLPVLLFIGFAVTGCIQTREDLLGKLIYCGILWVLEVLFFKKAINRVLHKVLEKYQEQKQQ
ncbi:MAG: hypothetical protein QM640_17165 [Niabella sp.]